jgi:hypothetical protein
MNAEDPRATRRWPLRFDAGVNCGDCRAIALLIGRDQGREVAGDAFLDQELGQTRQTIGVGVLDVDTG